MLTNPEPDTATNAPRIIFNLESLLLDTVAGVRYSLNAVARIQRKVWAHPLTQEDLRSRSLTDVISEIAGCADPALIAELVEHYWHVYKQAGRFRAPLLPGAAEWVEQLCGMGAELHYVSTWGPAVAAQFVELHGLQRPITTIFTPPSCVCPCARASQFESFIQSEPHSVESYLLLSDSHAELLSAQRFGVPALALAYGQAPGHLLETLSGLLGVAESVADVGHWILAQSAATQCLRTASRRRTFRLH